VAATDLAAWSKLSDGERRQMLQAMLAERFKLKVHHEPVMIPVYELVVAKGGAKVHAARPGEAATDEVKGLMALRYGGCSGQVMGNTGRSRRRCRIYV
jgi:uncharacterized protein (TIGR03435 family)